MCAIASQITSLTIVYSIIYSDADQRKHQSSASLAFVWVIYWGPVYSPHKRPVTRKMFPFDDVIMLYWGACTRIRRLTSSHHLVLVVIRNTGMPMYSIWLVVWQSFKIIYVKLCMLFQCGCLCVGYKWHQTTELEVVIWHAMAGNMRPLLVITFLDA